MKAVIIGGSGLIGTRVAEILASGGHEVIAASRRNGIDAVTGEGLAEALAGADVLVDVSNSPSFEDQAVMEFFQKTTTNLAKTGKQAGIRHFVALSVVGTDRLPENGYFRAKLAQETIIRSSGIPYTILRATQFIEFLDAIAYTATSGNEVRVSTAFLQPIAANDVSRFVAEAAQASPANGIIEIAGPERFPMDVVVKEYLALKEDARTVIGDAEAEYFGAKLLPGSLVSDENPKLGSTTLKKWLADQAG
ncbi:SDR family oxidoreductase [Rhizobiaceae bacterium n13]|uniref:SDR family oxidoreductase n=1 Tax=Ferirhizobium litorale TaxID=2927786 RepID=A0AAE3QAN1_9HYPH|nr:SDR family oxidoreductase [Fererhizobium litorale]MDI7863441.1 SDR family oxidoreductase [Fererhizobium litorale]MDI7922282.1 SDR family oxidoreductase [Fererhizobium litorale]